MRILGIDPGIATIGFGIIDFHHDTCQFIDYGCIKTAAGIPFPERLKQIHQDLETICKQWHPTEVAIEEIFFSKNVKTAIQVAQARGAIIQQLANQNFRISEYKPQQIKEALCGYGRAEKKQIQKMVQMMLHMDHFPTPDDAADALAIAICHGHSLKLANLFNASLSPA